MRYDYNIINHRKGFVVLFKTIKQEEEEDMNSELEIIVEAAPDAFTEDWAAVALECKNPSVPEINQLLFDVTKELGENDPTSMRELVKLCEKIATYNNRILVSNEGVLINASR